MTVVLQFKIFFTEYNQSFLRFFETFLGKKRKREEEAEQFLNFYSSLFNQYGSPPVTDELKHLSEESKLILVD